MRPAARCTRSGASARVYQNGAGEFVLAGTIEQPGKYEAECHHGAGVLVPPLSMGLLVGEIVAMIFAGLLGLAGIVLLVIGFVQRSSGLHRR